MTKPPQVSRALRRQFLVAAGGVLAAPLARAQRPTKTIRLGILTPSPTIRTPLWDSFFAALRERGWREGTEYSVELKETRGDPARALDQAKELFRLPVDLLLAISTGAAFAAKQASGSVPVVTWCGYPVEAGLAASLARPGGNVTGVANYAGAEVWGKFVELLRELRPGLGELGVLWDYAPPGFPDGLVALPIIQGFALRAGIGCRIWMVRAEQDLTEALGEIGRGRTEALVMSTGGGVHIQPAALARIRDLILRRRLPAITDIVSGVFLEGGCVLAYSPNLPELQRRLAHFVDRILRGANPGELPFELPSRFDLVVNTKSARALGLTIPQPILLRADRIVE